MSYQISHCWLFKITGCIQSVFLYAKLIKRLYNQGPIINFVFLIICHSLNFCQKCILLPFPNKKRNNPFRLVPFEVCDTYCFVSAERPAALAEWEKEPSAFNNLTSCLLSCLKPIARFGNVSDCLGIFCKDNLLRCCLSASHEKIPYFSFWQFVFLSLLTFGYFRLCIGLDANLKISAACFRCILLNDREIAWKTDVAERSEIGKERHFLEWMLDEK